MIIVKRLDEPEVSRKLRIEKDKLKSYINHVNSLNNESEDNELRISRSFQSRNLKHIAPNWYFKIKEQFHGKCAYCESHQSGSDYDVDFFRPRNGVAELNDSKYSDYYVWLAYDWENIYLSCRQCNMSKRDHFPVIGNRAELFGSVSNEKNQIIDPCHDDPSEHLLFKSSGEVLPLTPMGETTIMILGLNRLNLVEQRQKKYNEVLRHISEINSSDFSKDHIKYAIKNLFNLLSKENSYIAVVLQCLNDNFNYMKGDNIKYVAHDISLESLVLLFIDNIGFKEPFMPYKTVYVPVKEDLNTQEAYQIERLEIKNIRGISFDYEFNFENNSNPCLMILGENGTGKTTVLQSIVLALNGLENDFGFDPQSLISANEESYINVKIKNIKEPFIFDKEKFSQIDKKKRFKFPLVAYGSTRLAPSHLIELQPLTNSINVSNLFSSTTGMYFIRNFDDWTKDVDLVKTFSQVVLDILPYSDRENIDLIIVDGNLKVKRNKILVDLRELSSGYQSIITVVIDIMNTVYKLYKLSKIVKGIVLIDEIDAHLHPSWKMRIVEKFRTVFPQVQFIFTSHDPLCLRGMKVDETVIFKKSNSKIGIMNDIPNFEGLEIDEILTSDLFGLTSTIDTTISDNITRYYEILGKVELNHEESIELEGLKEKLNSPTVKYLGATNRERMLNETIDQYIAKQKELVKPSHSLDDSSKARIIEIWNGLNGDQND